MKEFFEKTIVPKIFEKAKGREFLIETLQIDLKDLVQQIREQALPLLTDENDWNPEKMGQFCQAVDRAFGDILSTADPVFLNSINRIRLEFKTLIQDHLKDEKRWKTLEWRDAQKEVSREKTIQNVQAVVSAYLGTVTAEKLKKITDTHFQNWGLTRAITNNPHFNSHIDVLVAAFGESHGILKTDFNPAGPKSWITRESTVERVKTTVQEKLNLTFPPKDTEAWKNERAALLALQQKDFRAWGLKRSYAENPFFTSHRSVLAEAFGAHYEFKREDFSADTFSWKSRQEVIANVKETITEKLNLTFPKVGTPEWHEERRRIMALDSQILESWGLKPAFSSQKYGFKSYIKALEVALAYYLLFREDFMPLEWKTREQTIENVKKVVTQKLWLQPVEGPTETFHRQRAKIKGLKADTLQSWGLGSAFGKDNKFFQSHMDLLSEVFSEYILDYGMFKYSKEFKPRNRHRSKKPALCLPK
jgi:hypothetical protein